MPYKITDSEDICSVGYEEDKKELRVLVNGYPLTIYYMGVPLEVYENFMKTEAKGTMGEFYNKHIKDKYPKKD